MKIVFYIAFSFHLIFIVSAIFIPLSISYDPGEGFLTLRSMLNGSSFCHAAVPNRNNISMDIEQFSTWWTPGQYLVPSFFLYTLKTNIGTSIILTVIIFSITGLCGYYKMFILYGFEKKISLLSVSVIVFQRFFSFPFSVYNGGEVLLFGALPWIFIAFNYFSALSISHIPILVSVALFGFFLKSSFLIIFFGLCFYLFLKKYISRDFHPMNILSIHKNQNKPLIYYTVKICILILSVFILLYIFFLRFSTPATLNRFNFELMDLLVPLSSPLVSAFSVDDLLIRIFDFPGFYSISNIKADPVYFYLPLSLLNLILLNILYKKNKGTNIFLLLLTLYILYVFFFLFFYTFDASISYESRHFRILGLLLIPFLLKYILECTQPLQSTFLTLIFTISIYGILSFFQRKYNIYKNYPLGKEYFYQSNLDRETLNFVHKLDDNNKTGNNLFYLTSPEISLEIKHNRVISSHADFQTLSLLEKQFYYGQVDNLFLILQNKLEIDGKESIIKSSFLDYLNFNIIYQNDNYKILKGYPK